MIAVARYAIHLAAAVRVHELACRPDVAVDAARPWIPAVAEVTISAAQLRMGAVVQLRLDDRIRMTSARTARSGRQYLECHDGPCQAPLGGLGQLWAPLGVASIPKPSVSCTGAAAAGLPLSSVTSNSAAMPCSPCSRM